MLISSSELDGLGGQAPVPAAGLDDGFFVRGVTALVPDQRLTLAARGHLPQRRLQFILGDRRSRLLSAWRHGSLLGEGTL
jgi:hypothetical protein